MIIIDELKAIKSTKKELMKFGILLGIVFGLIGAYLYWDGKIINYYFFIFALLITSIGILFPKYLLPLHKVWMGLAIILGFFVSRIVLSLLFYFVVTPLGVALRILGNDLLKMKIEKNADSYWVKKEKKKPGKSSAENQY